MEHTQSANSSRSRLAWGMVILMSTLLISCGGTPPPPLPSPMPSATPSSIPSPTPKPTPTPVPSPTPSALPVLKANGSKWSTELIGISSCCGNWGWPQISADLLKRWSGAGGNLVHIRLGPFWKISEGVQFDAYESVGSKADLTRFRAAYWTALTALIDSAASQGVYVEVDMIDGWPMRPANQKTSPWLAANNIQGETAIGCGQLQGKLKPRHEAWVRKIVSTVARPNVIYQIGNENGVCSPPVTAAWESDMVRIIRDEEKKHNHIPKMIGTNSEIGAIESLPEITYVSLHQDLAAAVHHGKPTGVNEYPKITPNTYAAQLRSARTMSTRFDLWLDDASESDLNAYLQVVRDYRAGH